MIISLEGTIEMVAEKFCVISVAGIGYRVSASQITLQKIPEKGGKVKLWTYDHVREDMRDLYGFLHFAELELFETLLSVSGIGPKGALGILGMGTIDSLKRAIASGDASYLTRVAGVGRKTAEKIIVELKDKMARKTEVMNNSEMRFVKDALDALVSLGYSEKEARDAVAEISDKSADTQTIVKAVLKKLNKR